MTKSTLEYALKDLPSTLKITFEEMPQNKVDAFTIDFKKYQKTTLATYLFIVFLGAHYAYLGKWGMCLLFWLTAVGCGLWAFIDLFRIPKMVDSANFDIGTKIINNLK